MTRSPEEQPELLPGMVRATVRASQAKARATRARTATEATVATTDPVARVLVDVPLAHLDRPFDYQVPATMAEAAVPGARVKVRFAGQDVDGYVVARAATTDHNGLLANLRRVVSPEPVLTPAIAALTADVAQRYAGTRSDVLRLAVPARHATAEKEPSPPAPAAPAFDARAAAEAWRDHEPGEAFLRHLADGGSPRAVWGAAPGTDWPHLLAHAAAAAYAGGRGALLCAPDGKDVARVDRALTALLGDGHHVALTADVGPARRYTDFLAVSRGARRIVVGTRAAGFAPVRDLGLVAIWDDGDDLHAEPRAPYPHTRETLLLRAEREDTAVLVGGFPRHPDSHTSPRGDPDRPGRRSGPRADPAQRVRRVPGLRALPHAGALRDLCRAAGADRSDHPAVLPLVRHGRAGLGLPGVRPPGPASPRAGRRPHCGGARPLVPQDPGPHLQRRPHPRRRRRRPRRGRRDAGGRAGRDGGLRRGGPPGHLADARPRRPAHR
jgi:hypothetical protein